MRLIKEIPLPEISLNAKIRFAILCTKEVCKDPEWNTWADGWLSGKDRSAGAAWTTAEAAWAAAEAAWAAAEATARAAWAAAEAAGAAAGAAEAAARAARAAGINLIALAKRAIAEENK
jgi:pyruvate/2-oxoglutarate dehydrogenase complex dihydrolipoamide acyltransferase (E2) component